jgi:myosin heavy subunit
MNGDKVILSLVESERADCAVAELKKPNFEALVEHTMDFSLTASKGLPDMVDIDELNHATLMQNLHARYSKDEIYTYVGPIILAMNPFKSLDSKLYGPQQMELYKSILTSKQPYEDKKIFPPHIWTITALAYR